MCGIAGVVSLAMLVMHGGAWLSLKADGAVRDRARRFGATAALVAVAAFVLAGLWLAVGIDGYRLAEPAAVDGPSNPLMSAVARDQSWLAAYAARPWIAIAPLLGIAGALMAWRGLKAGRDVSTLLWSKLSIFGVIATVGLTMFPFILPSSTAPDSSLTVWDSSSSHLTLFVMLVMAVIFVPIILAYTSWVYAVLWGKVTEAEVTENSDSVY